MPLDRRFRIGAVAELYQGLRYAPPETKRKQMDRAEALLAEIEPDAAVPEEFVIYRVTNFRPERSNEPTLLVGEPLRTDLCVFIQRLSESLELSEVRGESRAVPLKDVARRLGVSTKTVQRYRNEGLICHSVLFDDGQRRLACYEDAIDAFAQQHAVRVQKANAFSRVNAKHERDIIEAARVLRAREDVSLHEAAQRIAAEHDRAVETVRGILRRHDRAAPQPIFHERGPLDAREHRRILRASEFGVPVNTLAERFGRSRQTIHRAIRQERAERLRGYALHWPALPTLERADADEVLLSPRIVRERLDEPALNVHLPELLAMVQSLAPLTEDEEHALIAARALLLRRAAHEREYLCDDPPVERLDAIEMSLRWAALLKRKLVVHGLQPGVKAVEQALHRPLLEHPKERIRDMLRLTMHVVSETIDALDPTRGDRLVRKCAFAVDKALASKSTELESTRVKAAARHDAGAFPLNRDPLAEICPWQRDLMLRPDIADNLHALDDDRRELIERRYGLAGTPPQTLAALARQRGTSAPAVARLVLRGIETSKRRNAERSEDKSTGQPVNKSTSA